MTTEKFTGLRLAQMHHLSADQQLMIAKLRPKEADYWLKEANISRMQAFRHEAEARERVELGLEP